MTKTMSPHTLTPSDRSDQSRSHRPARPHRRLIITSIAILALLVGSIGITTSLTGNTVTEGPRDLQGNTVTLDPGTLPKASIRNQMNATADEGERLIVPAVGLDAPIGAITAVDGILTPPGFTSAYAVRNIGADITNPNDGTIFLVTHSLRNGGVAPGNYLIDVQNGTAAVKRGDEIIVAGTTYAITDTISIPKPKIGANPDLWASTPGRLVIITCLQLPSGKPSTQNMVIIATTQ